MSSPRPPRRATPRGGSTVAEVVVLFAACAAVVAASLPWLGAFDTPAAAPTIVGAAVVSAALAIVAARWWHLPPWIAYTLSIAAWAATCLGIAGTPAAAAAGFAEGPSRILGETLPVTGVPAQILAPLTCVWLAGAATGEVVTRARHSSVALGIPVISYLAAYAATTGAPTREYLAGAVLLGALGALALGRTAAEVASVQTPGARSGFAGERAGLAGARSGLAGERAGSAGERAGLAGETPGALRAWVAGATGIAVVASLAVGLGRLPGLTSSPLSLRRVPRISSPTVVDPVDLMGALRDDKPHSPPRQIATVTLNRPSTGYLGVAVLDHYDGATWSFSQTFDPTGGRVPTAPPGEPGTPTDHLRVLTQQITLLRPYGLPLLPVAERPVSVGQLSVDASASGMVSPAGSPSYPLSYQVRSAAPLATLSSIPAADTLDTSDPVADLSLPSGTGGDLSVALRYLATITGRRPSPTLGWLQAALGALRRVDRRVDPALLSSGGAAPATKGGTSLAEVISAVTVYQRATPEQFATLFALAARDLGIPARLVTGFRVPAPRRAGSGGATLPAGTYQVTNRDAWTWVQVPVQGLGWVVADPTPVATASPIAPPPSRASASLATVPPRRANALPAPGAGGHHALAPPRRTARLAGAGGPLGLPLLADILLLGALAACAGVPLLAWGRRSLRRRVRRVGDPAGMAVGAWLETLDWLSLAGVRTEPSATAAEVAASAASRFGDEVGTGVGAVGRLAEQAIFCPTHPPTPDAARRAWSAQRQLRRSIAPGLGARQRTAAVLRVGPQPARPGATRAGTGGRGARRAARAQAGKARGEPRGYGRGRSG